MPIAWVMDDFGGGTFPPWFKNVTEHRDKKTGQDNCPRPCAHGVFNETTKMWGCQKNIKKKIKNRVTWSKITTRVIGWYDDVRRIRRRCIYFFSFVKYYHKIFIYI